MTTIKQEVKDILGRIWNRANCFKGDGVEYSRTYQDTIDQATAKICSLVEGEIRSKFCQCQEPNLIELMDGMLTACKGCHKEMFK